MTRMKRQTSNPKKLNRWASRGIRAFSLSLSSVRFASPARCCFRRSGNFLNCELEHCHAIARAESQQGHDGLSCFLWNGLLREERASLLAHDSALKTCLATASAVMAFGQPA